MLLLNEDIHKMGKRYVKRNRRWNVANSAHRWDEIKCDNRDNEEREKISSSFRRLFGLNFRWHVLVCVCVCVQWFETISQCFVYMNVCRHTRFYIHIIHKTTKITTNGSFFPACVRACELFSAHFPLNPPFIATFSPFGLLLVLYSSSLVFFSVFYLSLLRL